jgi:lysophospholipase L1-like esterase
MPIKSTHWSFTKNDDGTTDHFLLSPEGTRSNVPVLSTDSNGNASGLIFGDNTSYFGKSIGTRAILLGDSMMLAHHKVLPSASASFSRTNNVATVAYTGHALVTGQLITVTGLSASGFNANRVEITRVDANSFTYPNVGANVGATAGSTSTSTNCITILDQTDNRGWVNHANSLLNGGIRIVNNSGVGGDTFAMMRSRLATDVDPYLEDFDILFLHGGYNNIATGGATASTTAWADCKAIIDKYCNLNKTVVLTTVLPIGADADVASGSGNDTFDTDADFQRELLSLRKMQLDYVRSGLIVVDGYLDAIDPLDANGLSKPYMTGDGTHPTAKLARLIGTRIYNALSSRQTFPDLRAVSAADNYATSSTSLQLLNAGWAATGGTWSGSAGTPFTQTACPNGFLATYSGTLTSATTTAPARTDGFGYDLLMESVVRGGAGNTVARFTVPAGSYADGDYIVGVCEVVVTGDPGNINGIYGQIVQTVTGPITGYAYGNAGSDSGATGDENYGLADGTYLIVTPPMKVQASVTVIYFDVIVASNAAGTITSLRFGRPAVYKNIYNNRA